MATKQESVMELWRTHQRAGKQWNKFITEYVEPLPEDGDEKNLEILHTVLEWVDQCIEMSNRIRDFGYDLDMTAEDFKAGFEEVRDES